MIGKTYRLNAQHLEFQRNTFLALTIILVVAVVSLSIALSIKGERVIVVPQMLNEEVWVLDEAGKLGNKPLLEFLKVADKNNARVIFSGSVSQLSSVSRGGCFELFCERYGSQTLVDI